MKPLFLVLKVDSSVALLSAQRIVPAVMIIVIWTFSSAQGLCLHRTRENAHILKNSSPVP